MHFFWNKAVPPAPRICILCSSSAQCRQFHNCGTGVSQAWGGRITTVGRAYHKCRTACRFAHISLYGDQAVAHCCNKKNWHTLKKGRHLAVRPSHFRIYKLIYLMWCLTTRVFAFLPCCHSFLTGCSARKPPLPRNRQVQDCGKGRQLRDCGLRHAARTVVRRCRGTVRFPFAKSA